MNSKTTDFGYRKVAAEDKASLVSEVFRSVAGNYDLMNDLMSFGVHRLWKRHAINLSGIKKGQSVLDVAGGTGDLSKLFHQRVGKEGTVLMTDINSAMLLEGRDKMIDAGIVSGIDYVQANAEILPFADNSFDCISIAFGLRNVTDKQKAINSMFEKLRYGGCLIILEFSKVELASLASIYDAYSFNVIPKIGKFIAKDEESYQYLVESIRMHPDQETLKGMIETAGFSRVEYFNLMGGVVAIHRAYKL
jgi:demethylmenaquinone methyltransferase/2-methoxy-6-polyprenyl-1,4-benzoquinol methylase